MSEKISLDSSVAVCKYCLPWVCVNLVHYGINI